VIRRKSSNPEPLTIKTEISDRDSHPRLMSSPGFGGQLYSRYSITFGAVRGSRSSIQAEEYPADHPTTSRA
jgi:hypothetical protein